MVSMLRGPVIAGLPRVLVSPWARVSHDEELETERSGLVDLMLPLVESVKGQCMK